MRKEKLDEIVFHKSSCITCRKTLSEIDRMKINLQKRDFFKEPFTELELKKIIKLSNLSANQFLRKRDKMFKELNLEKTKHTENEIIKLMVKFPGLIKRPIIIKNQRVHVGKIEHKILK